MTTQAQGDQATNVGGETSKGAPPPREDAQTALLGGKAALLAKVRASDTERAKVADDTQQGEPGSGGSHTPAAAGATPAPATEKPKGPAAAAPAPSAEIAEIKAAIAALAAKLEPPKTKEEPKPAETAKDRYDALVERIKADPGAVFDEFGDLLTIEKISEAHLKRAENPAHAELTGHAKEIAALKAKLEDREKADAAEKARAATEAAEKQGRDVVKGIVEADKGRWARVARSDENMSEAIADAVDAGRRVVAELRKTKGESWKPSDDEAKAILQDCLDTIEKDFAARAARYGAPDIAPKKTEPAAPRATIPASAPAAGGVRPPPAEPKTPSTDLASAKADIVRRVRRAARTQQE
ncbi:MAG TPA: hypothetical protein VI384_04280 [Candidatus Dormibacteraeota bacterium]